MAEDLNPADSPFHAGEQDVQLRLGVRDIEAWARKVVRPYLPEDHRAFHTTLPFLVVAARDAEQRPWATLLTGGEGFVTSPDNHSLLINAQPVSGDALDGALVAGADLGILGIELATRRRNRVNGRLVNDGRAEIEFVVEQSFGNCPQYIREREWQRVEGAQPSTAARGARLTVPQREWIASADTFFIASGHRGEGANAAFGMDASHRGGDPGFVRVESETHLVFPDYAGNNHFNTIGNLVLDPRAGLLFVDFERGGLLQLTGSATVDWGSPALAQFPGAQRLVAFDVRQVVELRSAIPLRWDASAESVRVVEKIRESDEVFSYRLEARDGGALPDFEAGQHLPIELEIPGLEQPLKRTYSLSGPPGTGAYRISVKREPHGAASTHLHERVKQGAIIAVRKPAGDFVLPCSGCPLVLVSAGIGVTPMLSMLHQIVAEGGSRPVWFVHGARNGALHALADEAREVASRRVGIRIHVVYSQPRSHDRYGVDYDSEGRVDGRLLADLCTDPNAHYMMCGPVRFMADVQAQLEARGVPPEHIHTESFGPQGTPRPEV